MYKPLQIFHFRLLGRSGLRYSENRPRDSRFEYAQAWGIRPLQDQTCLELLGVCEQTSNVLGNFSGYPEN